MLAWCTPPCAAFAPVEGVEPLGMGEVEGEIRRIAEELARARPETVSAV